MSLSSRLFPHPDPLCWIYFIWAFSPSWDTFWSTYLNVIKYYCYYYCCFALVSKTFGTRASSSSFNINVFPFERPNGHGFVSSPILFTALPPRLKEMKSQESAAGSKLVLRCETSSEYSALRFKWFKNGNELNRKNKPQNIKIQKKPG